METKIISKKKGETRFEIRGADHALMGLLREELLKSKSVEFATYSTPHPLLEGFALTVRAKDPRKEVEKALSALKKDAAAAKKAFKGK